MAPFCEAELFLDYRTVSRLRRWDGVLSEAPKDGRGQATYCRLGAESDIVRGGTAPGQPHSMPLSRQPHSLSVGKGIASTDSERPRADKKTRQLEAVSTKDSIVDIRRFAPPSSQWSVSPDPRSWVEACAFIGPGRQQHPERGEAGPGS